MSLINASYFVKKLNIPNSGDAAIAETINSYINQYEPVFLLNVFGYPLYKAYKANSSEDRFNDIINGAEYIDQSGHTNKWPGLIEVIVPDPVPPATQPMGQKQSIIANFIYFHYRSENATQFTGVGEAIIGAENATMVSPRKKLALIWNEMGNGITQLMEFIEVNQYKYPEWDNSFKVQSLKYFAFVNPIF